jgi:hypothetical protein
MKADLLPVPDDRTDEPREVDPGEVPEDGTDLDSTDTDSTDLDSTDLDYVEMPCTDGVIPEEDDRRWEVFVPDEDEWDPQPGPGDFQTMSTDAVFSRSSDSAAFRSGACFLLAA